MAKPTTTSIVIAVIACAHVAAAQQPPRPNETPGAACPERSRGVTLSLAEYNRLVDLSSRPTQTPAGPPVAAVLSAADLRVRIERDVARGTFALTGDVLRPGVTRVPLLSGATVLDANLGGRPLPLVADGNAQAALVSGPGPFSMSLEWGAPLAFAPGRASFVLPVPPSGAARATIDLPGDQADVRLSSGLITRRSTNAGRTIIEATLDPGSATEVSWSMRDSAPVAAAREARSLADILTLVTIGDADVRMVALVDVSVVQGEPRSFDIRLPAGYELTGISGSSLDTSEPRERSVVLRVTDPALRRHQFLVSLERPHGDGSFALDTEFVSIAGVQRERGEIAIEGVGTLELTATEREGMHRMDVRELNPALHSLARLPVLSAFRYQRATVTAPTLAIDIKRFADAAVLAAIADRAVATTLVTSEGRALTEVSLTVQNRAQPFLKVTLPSGASIVSVDVAGQPAKPVLGVDGTRVPLLRPGFRPTGPYTVAFVYLHSGTSFEKKGEMRMTLPRMDIPVGIVEWEVFAPDRYSLKQIDGNVIEREQTSTEAYGVSGGVAGGAAGGVAETITVVPVSPDGRAYETREENRKAAPSQNVINLQRRAAGVLPVRVDVPRAGTSHQFVKPLVVDQETTVGFRYKRR
jgi:hypothetical protein